jgi:hypothetical protein
MKKFHQVSRILEKIEWANVFLWCTNP